LALCSCGNYVDKVGKLCIECYLEQFIDYTKPKEAIMSDVKNVQWAIDIYQIELDRIEQMYNITDKVTPL